MIGRSQNRTTNGSTRCASNRGDRVKTRGLRDWNIHPRRDTGTKRFGYSRFKRKLLFFNFTADPRYRSARKAHGAHATEDRGHHGVIAAISSLTASSLSHPAPPEIAAISQPSPS